MPAWVKVAGTWRAVQQPYVKVAGTWRAITDGWAKSGGTWRRWWPVDEAPTCPGPGNYEPSLVSGGGSSGGSFEMKGLAGCGITAAHAKIGFPTIPDATDTPVNVYGSPSGTFYRTINITDEWTNRTIYFDMGATAAAQFQSGAATGYSITGSGTFWIASSRLRVTIT